MNRRRGILVLSLFLTVWLIPGTAMADPPSNDEVAGAVVIDALPFHATQDTTMATVSEAELAIAQQCQGPPDYAAGVWYTMTAPADGGFGIDGGATDYSVGFLVYAGTPDALELITCFPGGGPVFVEAGTSYYILVIDDQGDGGGNGGTLDMHVFDLGAELCPGLFEADPVLASGNLIMGTEDDDVLEGTSGRDIIIGLGGHDTIHALGGDDVVFGCDGDDHIDGGPGHDELHGDAFGYFGNPGYEGGGDDFVTGRGGNDLVWGGAGDDTLRGGTGHDFVVGHQGNDIVKGHRGNDDLLGGLGDDIIEGHKNDDFLSGGWGADVLKAGRGNDVMNGAPPAFGPGEDPEPDVPDECLGGGGADIAFNCTVVKSAQYPELPPPPAAALQSWGLDRSYGS